MECSYRHPLVSACMTFTGPFSDVKLKRSFVSASYFIVSSAWLILSISAEIFLLQAEEFSDCRAAADALQVVLQVIIIRFQIASCLVNLRSHQSLALHALIPNTRPCNAGQYLLGQQMPFSRPSRFSIPQRVFSNSALTTAIGICALVTPSIRSSAAVSTSGCFCSRRSKRASKRSSSAHRDVIIIHVPACASHSHHALLPEQSVLGVIGPARHQYQNQDGPLSITVQS